MKKSSAYDMIAKASELKKKGAISMIWTAEEKAKIKIIKISRKNILCRYLMIPVLVMVTIFFAFYHLILRNVKKLCFVFGVCFFSVMYCSFSFPMFIQDTSEIADSDGEARISFAPEYSGMSSLDKESIYTEDEIAMEEETLMEEVDYLDFYLLEDILNYSEESAKPKSEVNLDYQNITFDASDWKLVLINKQNSIPEDYEVSLGSIKTMKGERQCDSRIIEELLEMISDAKKDNVTLAICSPYRDMKYQEKLFQRKIVRYMQSGMSYLDAFQKASETVTVPGASEHQIGLALDIVSNTYTSLDEGFGKTAAGKWLEENSYRYGFILRYPKDKEYVTGISYEPWHYRYVGVEAATYIMKNQITLEEFWETQVVKSTP